MNIIFFSLLTSHDFLSLLGIGGQIEVHADFWGHNYKYDSHPGGDRLGNESHTYMILKKKWIRILFIFTEL